MPDQRLLVLARDARVRAGEVLTRAETFRDAVAKQKMREVAENTRNWRSGSKGSRARQTRPKGLGRFLIDPVCAALFSAP
jgi:hypothetical protein